MMSLLLTCVTFGKLLNDLPFLGHTEIAWVGCLQHSLHYLNCSSTEICITHREGHEDRPVLLIHPCPAQAFLDDEGHNLRGHNEDLDDGSLAWWNGSRMQQIVVCAHCFVSCISIVSPGVFCKLSTNIVG